MRLSLFVRKKQEMACSDGPFIQKLRKEGEGKTLRSKRLLSFALAVLLFFCYAIPVSGTATAADTVKAGVSKESAPYFLVKKDASSEWSDYYNWIHYINLNGVTTPCFCVESDQLNPVEGTGYVKISENDMGYSADTLWGLQQLVRSGYPYHTTICGNSLNTEQAHAKCLTFSPEE